jgi:GT2 family glycosyltransferase
LFPGHAATIDEPDLTASAGAALAVDRQMFLKLGGFDPLYLPGRLEDLDLCYRAYLAGWHARYVPAAVAYHRGAATFRQTYTALECERLALRNTLLFQWKNVRHPWHVCRQAAGLAVRLACDLARAPATAEPRRFATWRALQEAMARIGQIEAVPRPAGALGRELAFFRRFAPRQLAATAAWGRAKSFTSPGVPRSQASLARIPA